jgi:hypothetical protein
LNNFYGNKKKIIKIKIVLEKKGSKNNNKVLLRPFKNQKQEQINHNLKTTQEQQQQ